MYGSPAVEQSREAKKLCSKIKGHTTSFEKLVTSWNHNCSEVSQLLYKLSKDVDNMMSCGKASKSVHMTSIKKSFPDLFEKLIGNLLVEIEDICLQIKVFMRILRDVNTAMQLQAYECANLVSSYTSCDTVFGGEDSSLLLATEDVLDLQKKYYQYNQQLVHKEQIIKTMLSRDVKYDNIDDYWLQKSSVIEVIENW